MLNIKAVQYHKNNNGEIFAFEALVVYRVDNRGLKEYLICNGSNMGRMTHLFGANCLADSEDCRNFVAGKLEENPDLIVENYLVTPC